MTTPGWELYLRARLKQAESRPLHSGLYTFNARHVAAALDELDVLRARLAELETRP